MGFTFLNRKQISIFNSQRQQDQRSIAGPKGRVKKKKKCDICHESFLDPFLGLNLDEQDQRSIAGPKLYKF